MTTIHILYFAGVRDARGAAEEELDLPDGVTSVAQLSRHLEQLHPTLSGRLGHVRFAINESFASSEDRLGHGDTVALIPPVAGG